MACSIGQTKCVSNNCEAIIRVQWQYCVWRCMLSIQKLKRRMESLFIKAYEMGEVCDVDIALVIRTRTNGRYVTYDSVNLESWPPSKEQIVSQR